MEYFRLADGHHKEAYSPEFPFCVTISMHGVVCVCLSLSQCPIDVGQYPAPLRHSLSNIIRSIRNLAILLLTLDYFYHELSIRYHSRILGQWGLMLTKLQGLHGWV